MDINPRAAYLPITLTKGEPTDFLLNLQTWSEIDIDLGNCTVTLDVGGVRSEEVWHVDVKGNEEFPGSVVLEFPELPPGRYTYEVWADFGSEDPSIHVRKQKLIEGGLTMISSMALEYDAGTLPELAVGHRQILVRVGPAEEGLIKANILYPGYMAEKMESARKSAEAAKQSELNARESEKNAKASEEAAKKSEQNAAESERNAKESEESARKSAEEAKDAARRAQMAEGKSSYEHWLEHHPGGTFEEYMKELSGGEWMHDHIENKDIHVQPGEREKWNQAESNSNQALAAAVQALAAATQAMADATEALTASTEAEKNANDAKDKAENAEQNANDAKDKADKAEQNANDAKDKADKAEQNANDAKDKADQAGKDAQDAKDKADQAAGKSDKAEQDSNKALADATEALGDASEALAKAIEALGQARQSAESAAKSAAEAQKARETAEAASKEAQGASAAAKAAQARAEEAMAAAQDAMKEAQEAKKSCPVGTIVAYGSNKIPDGWLLCDGSEVSKDSYPALFDAIGTVWGGDGAPNFKLPGLRGRYLAGALPGIGQGWDTNTLLSGTVGAHAVGETSNPHLPNITGASTAAMSTGHTAYFDNYLLRGDGGAFYIDDEQMNSFGSGDNQWNYSILKFDAHRSSWVYGDEGGDTNEVRPNTAWVNYIIKCR